MYVNKRIFSIKNNEKYTLNSFLNEALGTSFKEHGISFQSFVPILEKSLFYIF